MTSHKQPLGYTPAPWVVADGRHFPITTLNGWRVALVERWDELPHAEANARLIAAAPELLAASQYALEVLAPQKDDDFVWSAMSQLMAAIAKATGAA